MNQAGGTRPKWLLPYFSYLDTNSVEREANCPVTYTMAPSSSTYYDTVYTDIAQRRSAVYFKDSFKETAGTYDLIFIGTALNNPTTKTVTMRMIIKVCDDSTATLGRFENGPVFSEYNNAASKNSNDPG